MQNAPDNLSLSKKCLQICQTDISLKYFALHQCKLRPSRTKKGQMKVDIDTNHRAMSIKDYHFLPCSLHHPINTDSPMSYLVLAANTL